MDNAHYLVDKRTFVQRLVGKFFPEQICLLPEAPAEWKDCIHLNITCCLSLGDRIRLLFCGKLKVRAKVVTENAVGATVSNSVCYPVGR